MVVCGRSIYKNRQTVQIRVLSPQRASSPLGVTTAGSPFSPSAQSMFSARVKPANLQGPDPALTPHKSQAAPLISHHGDNLGDCNSVQQRLRAASAQSGRGLGQANRISLLWVMSATDLHCDVGPGPFLFQAFRIQRGCSWTAMQVSVCYFMQ